jgi:hypothetical protein
LAIFAAENLGIGEEIAVQSGGKLHRNLDRLVVFKRSKL